MPLFEHVCRGFFQKQRLAKDLFSFQAGVAMLFANERDASDVREPVKVESIRLIVVSRLSCPWGPICNPLFVTEALHGLFLIG